MLSRKTARITGIFFVMLMLVTSMVMPLTAFAADPADSKVTEGLATLVKVSIDGGVKSDNVKKAMNEVNKKYSKDYTTDNATINYMYYKSSGKDELIGAVVESDKYFVIYKDAWNSIKQKERTKAMKTFVDELQKNSDVDEDALHTFINDIQEQDSSVGSIMLPMIMEGTKADLYQAYQIVKPFLDVLNIVLGVGCVLLILLLFASTVMDLAYIGLPVWRESQANKGNGKNPFGVSYEAITTVQEVEKGIGGGDGGYKNAYIVYFKRRALTYIVLALCIMYLICGGISGIIAFVLSLTSGMV